MKVYVIVVSGIIQDECYTSLRAVKRHIKHLKKPGINTLIRSIKEFGSYKDTDVSIKQVSIVKISGRRRATSFRSRYSDM